MQMASGVKASSASAVVYLTFPSLYVLALGRYYTRMQYAAQVMLSSLQDII